MFAFKKAVVLVATLATLVVPAVASADDRDHRAVRGDDHAVVEHRNDRDDRAHGWSRDDRARYEADRRWHERHDHFRR
jgi:hypothetical protein